MKMCLRVMLNAVAVAVLVGPATDAVAAAPDADHGCSGVPAPKPPAGQPQIPVPAPLEVDAALGGFPADIDRTTLVEQIRQSSGVAELLGSLGEGAAEQQAFALTHLAFSELTLGLRSLVLTLEAAGQASPQHSHIGVNIVRQHLDVLVERWLSNMTAGAPVEPETAQVIQDSIRARLEIALVRALGVPQTVEAEDLLVDALSSKYPHVTHAAIKALAAQPGFPRAPDVDAVLAGIEDEVLQTWLSQAANS